MGSTPSVKGGCFRALRPGTLVDVKASFVRSFGFTEGRIINTISPLDSVVANGGFYRVESLVNTCSHQMLGLRILGGTYTKNVRLDSILQETTYPNLEREVKEMRAELGTLYRKISHGCIDASCPSCDKETE